jgi:hypothetical protein
MFFDLHIMMPFVRPPPPLLWLLLPLLPLPCRCGRIRIQRPIWRREGQGRISRREEGSMRISKMIPYEEATPWIER